MGGLTLNMLLSFAQFEREITGERIRKHRSHAERSIFAARASARRSKEDRRSEPRPSPGPIGGRHARRRRGGSLRFDVKIVYVERIGPNLEARQAAYGIAPTGVFAHKLVQGDLRPTGE